MLKIIIPKSFANEREYIIAVLIKKFLGIDYKLVKGDVNYTKVCRNNSHSFLVIPDSFFSMAPENWLSFASMPKRPLNKIALDDSEIANSISQDSIPIIFGSNAKKIFNTLDVNKSIFFNIDLFGSAFFMMSRYEEVVCKQRDDKNRFPATASLAFQESFLDRPIVNEYLEIFWVLIKRLWPDLERKPRKARVFISHDVDIPFKYGVGNLWKKIKGALRSAFIGGNIKKPFCDLLCLLLVRIGFLRLDPFNTFDFIMEESENIGVKSSFYFISGNTAGPIDGEYNLNDKNIRKLMCAIHDRGHFVGLHPSYNTYSDQKALDKEFRNLRIYCNKLGIHQEKWGGRQHYLRWEAPITFRYWDNVGLDYDSTLSFADHSGFRCGTCYEFPVFDLIDRKQLKLTEIPLIVMECSVLDKWYMGLQIENRSAFNYIERLINSCFFYNGDFSILWHNNRLVERSEKELYIQLLKVLKKMLGNDNG